MTQLNRVELIGRIASVRTSRIEDTEVAHFIVVTEFCYKNAQGQVQIESTWTNVVAHEGRKVKLDSLEKGSAVRVIGRLRNQRYIGAEGMERTFFEVLASSVEKVEDETVESEQSSS